MRRIMPGVVGGARKGTTTSTTTTSTTTINPSDPITLEGFGALAGGANTGNVYHVNVFGGGDGPGTLAYGLGIGSGGSSPTGKTIVFDAAGTITRGHTLTAGNNFTIDGTTAPYPGVTITANDDGLSLESGVHHVIVKGLAFINCTGDGMNVANDCHDVLITNCLAYGNHDGNIDLAATASTGSNASLQWCIIGSHINECHCGSGGAGGTLVTMKLTSVHHNLYFPLSPNPDEGERFPFVHCSYSPVSDPNCDIRNNIIYRYGRNNASGSGYGAGVGYSAHANIVNNYFYTPASAAADGIDVDVDGVAVAQVYSAGNISGNGIDFNSTSRYTNHAQFTIPAQYQITPESACAGRTRILAKAGLTQRNPVGGGRRPDEAAYIDGVTISTGC